VAAPDLLEQVVEAHGGAAFDSASHVVVHVGCGGWAFPMKRQRNALADFTGTVSTSEQHVVLAPYSGPGRRGVLERGAVRIETDAGEVLASREHPRRCFRRLRRQLWWDDLDLLYFASYALWGYVNAPFMFRRPDFEVEEAEPWREDGETWRALRVRFPEGLPAHSREQTYYFDDRGLLRRNDYTAEVFGSWAKAAHYCWEHESFDGVVVPTRRAAMPRRRNGKPVTAVRLVTIAIDDVAVRPGAADQR
jgi:hypothetical protein